MSTRQAKRLAAAFLALLTIATACSPSTPAIPTPANPAPDASPVPQATPTIEVLPTFTPQACLSQAGRLEQGSFDSFRPTQKFRVYLPPCYDEKPDERYPVLYLLHGQTYTDEQWPRLGAAQAADELIQSGEARPFIMVFPDDRYWNLAAGPGFGERLVEDVIPYIDATYRTIPSRNYRAIGGLSRGAGWSLRLGLTEWQLFGTIGLHSLAVLQKDGSRIDAWMAGIPSTQRPRIYMDIGDHDPELAMAQRIEAQLNADGLQHEWHLYSGDHTEDYWSAHVEEYIRWYAEAWNNSQ
jgi:enterochelin esterase-like enzyme